ncbi:MAG: hypothetical protein ACJAYE_000740 [Candidatus Azotimanducaceae bacterium]|jgi:hypothetical protein
MVLTVFTVFIERIIAVTPEGAFLDLKSRHGHGVIDESERARATKAMVVLKKYGLAAFLAGK